MPKPKPLLLRRFWANGFQQQLLSQLVDNIFFSLSLSEDTIPSSYDSYADPNDSRLPSATERVRSKWGGTRVSTFGIN